MWTMSKARRVLPAAGVALWAAGVLVSTPACSAGIYTTTRGSYESIERRAYDNGYRQGFDNGRSDAPRNRAFSLERHDEDRHAELGGRRRDRQRDTYPAAFRRGFEAWYPGGLDHFD